MDKNAKLRNFYDLIVPNQLKDNEFVRVTLIGKTNSDDELSRDFASNQFVKSFDEFCNLISKYRYSRNIYMSIATVNDNGTGEATNQLRRQVVFIDFDKKDYEHYKTLKDFTTHIKAQLPELYNHAIVDTGGGYHFYIAVEPTTDIKRLVEINRALVQILGADPRAASPTQIVRVPYSYNLKYEPRKTVSIVSNCYGTKQLKPYSLERLESIVRFAKRNKEMSDVAAQTTGTEFVHDTYYHCIEKMISEGANKGERNFCLGRIVKYLKEIRGYTRHSAQC